MMKTKSILLNLIVLGLILTGCGSNDTANQPESELSDSTLSEIKKEYKPGDSNIVREYAKDNSSISIDDLGKDDTSYSTRTKVLYKSTVSDKNKLAVVYGFKKDDGPGVAIVQRNNGTPIKMTQTKPREGNNELEYSDGKIRLVRSGTNAIFTDKDGSEQFEEIK